MNWNEIKEKYPKAVELIYECADKYAIGAFIDDYKYNRLLYDLFDEQGVYISAFYTAHWTNAEESEWRSYFDWEIYDKAFENIGSSEVEEPTRTEAEEQAFTKAFEILEEKLK